MLLLWESVWMPESDRVGSRPERGVGKRAVCAGVMGEERLAQMEG